MIDLRKSEAELTAYAQRYLHAIPVLPGQSAPSLAYLPQPLAFSDARWMQSVPQSISEAQALDKAQGALLGLAIADAVGTTLEFLPRDKQHVHDMVGGGPFNLQVGEWTDDTSMALCLAQTYLEAGSCDITLFRQKLVSWYKHGTNSVNGVCFDIGNATRHALDQFILQGPGWAGNTAAETAGNAAVIRHAPTAIFRRKSFIAGWNDARLQSIATHGATESISGCQLFNVILHHLLNGQNKQQSFAPHSMPAALRVTLINAGEYKQKSRDQIRSSGYVIDTLEAALWAVWQTDNFRDAVLLAANLADDADSVAATAGQLAGALYGLSGIPTEWVKKVAQREEILSLAEQLFSRAP